MRYRKHYLKYMIAGAVVIILVGFLIYRTIARRQATTSRPQSATVVKVEKPRRETVTSQLQYNGNISAIQQASIFSKVSGNLEKVYTDMGQLVKKNQLLALIDTTELYQQVLQNAATYYNARLNYDRTKQLLEQDLVAKEDLDNAQTSMKVAEANYRVAQSNLGYARIQAPFTGYVTQRFLDPGALVSPGSSILFTLMDMDTVKVIINVMEKDTPLIPKLTRATIVVDALPQQQFLGRVTRYSQAIDLATRTMATEIDIQNRDHMLKPGMFATAKLIVAEHPDAITLPTQAVLHDSQGSYVFVAENNLAKRISVTTGLEQNSRTEITSGLTGTEDVITTGQTLVRDGHPVKILP